MVKPNHLKRRGYMAYAKTTYANERSDAEQQYHVTFIVKATQTKLTRSFSSPFYARQFVNKLKHSKRCILVSCPLFN